MTVQPWEPTNERQHPPFDAGNDVAVQHGARSERRVLPLARELMDAVLVDADTAYLQAAQWRPALEAWARAEAQVELLLLYIGDGVGDLSKCRIRAAWDYMHRAETRAAGLRSQLGLTPLSRAKLGKDVAATRVDGVKWLTELAEAADQAASAERDQ